MRPLLYLILLLTACTKPEAAPAQAPAFAKGADIGWLTELEDSGRIFKDAQGRKGDLVAILKGQGLDAIRLRVWVTPANKYNGLQDVIAKSRRVKAAGLRLMIDFHYADNWADPGQQPTSAAWQALAPPQIAGKVYVHTVQVLQALKTEGIEPEWVQVGNEVRNGMLWPSGRYPQQTANFARYLDTGYAAVKRVFPKAQAMIHIDNGYNNAVFRDIFDALTARRVRFDAIGMSLYPPVGSGQAYAEQCLANCQDMIARYGKPVNIVEIGMPVEASAECRQLIASMIRRLKALPNSMGQGLFYWEPEAYQWRGYKLVVWGEDGKPTQAMLGFSD